MPASRTTFVKISDEAVKGKTGKTWKQWFRILDSVDVASNGHRHAAMTLHTKHKLNPWWSQAVTIRYEWERGLRTMKNQREAVPNHPIFRNPKRKKSA